MNFTLYLFSNYSNHCHLLYVTFRQQGQLNSNSMLRKALKWLLIICLPIAGCFKFVVRGNNRYTALWHHGIWLPSSTVNIDFTLYPDFPRILDDWAINECEMSKKDYFQFLDNRTYSYITHRDTSSYGTITLHQSGYQKIPDSLFNRFPASYKCKSKMGDFLVVSAKVKDSNTVKVTLYTDWN